MVEGICLKRKIGLLTNKIYSDAFFKCYKNTKRVK